MNRGPLSARLDEMQRNGQLAAMIQWKPRPKVIDVSARRWSPPSKLPQVSPADPALLATPENVALADEGLVISRIIRTVAEYYDVTPESLRSARRTKYLVRARHVAAYLAMALTKRSYPSVGAYLGGRDHTTIIHAVRVVSARMREDEDFALEVSALLMRLAPKKQVEVGYDRH